MQIPEVFLQFIKLPSTTSFRFYVKDDLTHRTLQEMLDKITVWQDHKIEYKGRTWLGYECLSHTDEAIETLLKVMYLAENITEEFLKDR